MKIPNADKAEVPEDKLRGYLLSTAHAVGRFKARFFASLGFTTGNWEELHARLREFAEDDAELGPTTEYGQKYLVFGRLKGRRVLLMW